MDTSVVSTLRDTLSRSVRMQLEINMSHNYHVFHNNPHELSVNEVSEIVTKKCKGLVGNLISKEVFERLQLEAVLRFANTLLYGISQILYIRIKPFVSEVKIIKYEVGFFIPCVEGDGFYILIFAQDWPSGEVLNLCLTQ